MTSGLISDANRLEAFLVGRLRTTGALSAHAAASVCARASRGPVPDSLWRAIESEIDARILSPATRASSRLQGGRLLRAAVGVCPTSIFYGLARATVSSNQQPHHPVALGAVAAAAESTPTEAAAAAAYASVAGPADAARDLLQLTAKEFDQVVTALEGAINALSKEAARGALRSPTELPCRIAPVLEYLEGESARAP